MRNRRNGELTKRPNSKHPRKKMAHIIVILLISLVSSQNIYREIYTTFSAFSLPQGGTNSNTAKGPMLTASTPSLLWKYQTEGTLTPSPALADLNDDGELDVIFASGDGNIYVVNGKNGSLFWLFQTGGVIDSSPALGDLNEDGLLDVLIGESSGGECDFYAINGENGTLLWNYKIRNGLEFSSPAVIDLDGDGKLEVAFSITARDPNFFVLNGEDGSLSWEFRAENALLGNSPAVGDLNGDGRLNLVFQSTYQPGFKSTIYMLDGKTGSLLWTKNMTKDVYMTSPSLYDVNYDGKLDIIIGNGDDHMYALNGADGTELWKYKTSGNIWSSPALGDLDLDNRAEVIFGGTNERIYALNGEDGSVQWVYKTERGGYSSPALGDINGDHRLDVVIGQWDGKLHAINGKDGSGLWTYQAAAGIVSSPALGDIDNDGAIEIIFGSEDGNLYALNPPTSGQRIYWQGFGGTFTFDRTRNLLDVDSDLDFLSDYSENILGTNISNFDSDNDGIPDGWEIGYGLNPLNAKDALVDSDNDGLSNREEYEWLTDPTDADMDNDGALDGEEVGQWLLNPRNSWFNPITRFLIITGIFGGVLGVPLVIYFFLRKYSRSLKDLQI